MKQAQLTSITTALTEDAENSILWAKNLSVGYEEKLIVANADFCLKANTILVILGPNGSGKTTILKTCLGLIPAIAGTALLARKPITKLKPKAIARIAAWVPQTTEAVWSYNAIDIVVQGRYSILGPLKPYGHEDDKAVENALNLMDALSFANRPYSSLSGGEARRILIARALAQESPLLVLDEPAAHLDPGRQIELMEILKNLAQAGKAIAVSLHDVNLAKRFADKILLINKDGTSVFGNPEEVLSSERLEDAYDTRFIHGSHEQYGNFVLPLSRKHKKGAKGA